MTRAWSMLCRRRAPAASGWRTFGKGAVSQGRKAAATAPGWMDRTVFPIDAMGIGVT
ncbi:hypothetical protein RM533_12960 [Croceicoccus sp. F390]|uniref:Uncharacterized protein n=1 Tax=Croceicoccus esteveae TaxID=3075597 RepID=A0ABU2ZKE3_9SPHN|nr:hypothetical protein [Croceicoccus sp. F390]MDT0577077.1 hypothetical protein [Croceicoccus sp. F390]